MADRILLEASAVDGFLLEDGTGVVLMEATAGATITGSGLVRSILLNRRALVCIAVLAMVLL